MAMPSQELARARQWLRPRAYHESDARHPLIVTMLVGLGTCTLALVVDRFDAPMVLGGLLLVAAAVVMVARPALATLLCAFLLYVNFPAILTKRHGLPAAVAGAFILLLAFPLLHHLLVRRERARVDAPWALMLVLLIAMLASSSLSAKPALALDGVVNYVAEGVVLYWLVVNGVRDLKSLRLVIGTLLAAGSLLAALSLYQELTGSYKQEFGGLAYRNYIDEADPSPEVARLIGHQDWNRAQGPVGEPNRFAQIMIVLVPLGLFLHRTSTTRRSRFCVACATSLIVGGVVLTLSRGAFLALGALAVTFVFLRWVHPSRLLVWACVFVMLGPLLTPYFLPRLQSFVAVGSLVAGGPSSASQVDGAVRGRATEMLAALHAFLDHPIIGVGPGLYTPLYSVEYQQKNPDFKFRDLQVPRRAHMLYIELAAELGVIGLTIFMAVVLVIVRQLWQARRRWIEMRPDLADLATGFLLSLFAYLTTALTMHLAYQRYYWFLLALAAAALHVMREQPMPHARTAPSRGVTHGDRPLISRASS